MGMKPDTVIVGAGPAGCAAAYDLARAGRQVLLLERRRFPRHKACACGLTRKTLAALRYSVEPVVERACNEIVLQGAGETDGREVRVRARSTICAMAVRERFDAFCLDQTLASGRNGGGVALRKIEAVQTLRELQDGVELDVATDAGVETLRAPVLIGADGSNGQIRQMAESLPHRGDTRVVAAETRSAGRDPAWYIRGFALEATIRYAELPAQLPDGGAPKDLVFDFAPMPGGYGWLFPKGEHINIGVGTFAPPAGDSPTEAVAHELRLKRVTRALLLEYARRKLGTAQLNHITGQHLGMGGHAYVPRGRVLLVGDAAGLVDPLTGEGIHSAIVSGQAVAAAIVSGWSGVDSGRMGDAVAAAYARALRPLQETLAFSNRAARAFYAEPGRGFRAMRTPILRSLILKTYADGVPYTGLVSKLAKLTT